MQKTNQKYFYLFLTSLFLTISVVFAQNGIPEKPKKANQTSVYDYATLLSTSQLNALEQKLIQYNDTTSTQIVVATVKTINGKNIALYATEWAHKWGIGDKDKDNGVFLLVAKDDRKLTIRTGYGVEHKLTDAYSRRIIEQVITPEFKQGKFYKGLDKGTTYIMSALNGEFQGTPQHESSGSGIPIIFIILFFIILIIILSNRNKGNRGRGYRNSTGSLLETIILSNSGRGGFGGGGFGGGSFGGGSSGGFGGGFGGGGFGGGGASGGW